MAALREAEAERDRLQRELDQAREVLCQIERLPAEYGAPPTGDPVFNREWARVGSEAYRLATHALEQNLDSDKGATK